MDTLDRAYRQQSIQVRAQTLRDLQRIWPLLDMQNIGDTFAPWAATVATLVQRDRRMVAGLSSAYIREVRAASGVAGSPEIILADRVPPAQMTTVLSVTAHSGYLKALRFYPPERAAEVAFVRTAGAVGRLVMNGGRDTVMGSIKADPVAGGWLRITAAGACKFCQMIAGRGAVYSADTAPFSAHDHCACMARPAFGTSARKVEPYTPSQRRKADGSPSTPAKPAPNLGFNNLSREQVQKQISITQGLPDSEWRTGQLARLRGRLGELR